jgi:hypothetical protein
VRVRATKTMVESTTWKGAVNEVRLPRKVEAGTMVPDERM